MSQRQGPAVVYASIPEGYTTLLIPNRQEAWAVPNHYASDMIPAFRAQREKMTIDTRNVDRKSSQVEGRPFANISTEDIRVPPNPDFTDEERLHIHSDILAYSQQLGISYKEASHRLYMSENAKLKVSEVTKKGLVNKLERMKNTRRSIVQKYGDFDPTMLKKHHDAEQGEH